VSVICVWYLLFAGIACLSGYVSRRVLDDDVAGTHGYLAALAGGCGLVVALGRKVESQTAAAEFK
jgi:hypothetical protein